MGGNLLHQRGIFLQGSVERAVLLGQLLLQRGHTRFEVVDIVGQRLIGLLQSGDGQRDRPLGRVGHLHHLVTEEVAKALRRKRLEEVLEILVVIGDGIVEHLGVHLQRAVVLHLDTQRLQVDVLPCSGDGIGDGAEQLALQAAQAAVAGQRSFLGVSIERELAVDVVDDGVVGRDEVLMVCVA